MTELPTYHGICPYCASAVSCVTRDGMTYARCSHRGCGARGPIMRSLDRAVEMFRAGKYVLPSPQQPDARRCGYCGDTRGPCVPPGCDAAPSPPQPDAGLRDVPHKAATERALAALATMPREELLRTFVDAGIVDENGKLTEAYRPVEPDEGRCDRCSGWGCFPGTWQSATCPTCNGTGMRQ